MSALAPAPSTLRLVRACLTHTWSYWLVILACIAASFLPSLLLGALPVMAPLDPGLFAMFWAVILVSSGIVDEIQQAPAKALAGAGIRQQAMASWAADLIHTAGTAVVWLLLATTVPRTLAETSDAAITIQFGAGATGWGPDILPGLGLTMWFWVTALGVGRLIGASLRSLRWFHTTVTVAIGAFTLGLVFIAVSSAWLTDMALGWIPAMLLSACVTSGGVALSTRGPIRKAG